MAWRTLLQSTASISLGFVNFSGSMTLPLQKSESCSERTIFSRVRATVREMTQWLPTRIFGIIFRWTRERSMPFDIESR